MHIEAHSPHFKVNIQRGTTSLAVQRVSCDIHKPYFEAEAGAIYVDKPYYMPRCETREQFIQALNTNKYLHVDDLQTCWKLSSLSKVTLPAPQGVYKLAEKEYELIKDANDSYALYGHHNYENFAEVDGQLVIRHSPRDFDLLATGTFANQAILAASAFRCVGDINCDANLVAAGVIEPTIRRGQLYGKRLILEQDGVIEFPALENRDRVELNLVDGNTGLLMQAPVIFFKTAHQQCRGYKTSDAYLKLRVAAPVESKNIVVLAQVPADSQRFVIQRSNLKYVIYAVQPDGTATACFETINLSASHEVAFYNSRHEKIDIESPVGLKFQAAAARDGIVTCAFKARALDIYNVVSAGKGDVEVQDGDLVVCGVDTSLAITQGNVYVVRYSRTADELQVVLHDVTAASVHTYNASSPVYSDSQSLTGNIVLHAACDILLFAYGDALQLALDELAGSQQVIATFGQLTDQTFANGAVLTSSGFEFNSEQYERLHICLSAKLSNTLRVKPLIVDDVTYGVSPPYDKRISDIVVQCSQTARKIIAVCKPDTQLPVLDYVAVNPNAHCLDFFIGGVDQQTGKIVTQDFHAATMQLSTRSS